MGQEIRLSSPFPLSPFRRRGINIIQSVRQYAGTGLGDVAWLLTMFVKLGDKIILQMDWLFILPIAPDIAHN